MISSLSKLSTAVAGAAILCLSASVSAQNLFTNPGFEDPITMDGPPFVGFWEGFAGAPVSSAANSTITPRSGLQSLELLISNTNNTFAGAFQDIPSLVPGSPTEFSGWYRSPSSPFDVGIEIRIEWRNSVANTEVSRTANLTPLPSSSYEQFTLSAVVPAGADSARAVYAIQSFGPGPTDSGTVYVDDMSFQVVPEPATMALLSIVPTLLLKRRR